MNDVSHHGGGGQSVEVTATDDTHLVNVAGALALSLSGAGVAVSIIVDVIDKDVTASIDDNVNVWAGGTVTVQAISTESIFELAVGGGASGGSASVAGSFAVLVWNKAGSHSIAASIGDATVHSGGLTHVKASDTVDKLEMYVGSISISASSAAVGVSVTVLVHDGNVDAHVANGANLTVGSLTVEAIQEQNVILVAGAGSGGSSAGIAGSVVVNVSTDNTTATLDGTTSASGSVQVKAQDTTTLLGVAGQIAVGGSAGVGVGVDVEVITKVTGASVAPNASVTTSGGGDVKVDAISSEDATSIAAGVSLSSSASVAVNATISVYDITTNATIGHNAFVDADGSVRVSADEAYSENLVAGNVAVGGAAGIGAAAVVPVISKSTNATIGHDANVTGKGNGGGLSVNDGTYTVTPQDVRFHGAGVSGNTIDTESDLGFQTGDAVTYDPGDAITPIGGLAKQTIYYVIRIDATHVQLADSAAHAQSHTAISITPGNGEHHRLIGTNQGQAPNDNAPRFDPSSDRSGNTLNLPYTLSLSEDDPVIYSSGGGQAIGGLEDGATYYAHPVGGNSYQLKGSKGGSVISLTSDGTGSSHSLVKQGNMPSSNADDASPQTIAPGSVSFRGVAVSATNSDNINSVGIAVSIGGSAGVGVGGTVNVLTVDTNATISHDAQINTDAAGVNTEQSVLVKAGNAFHMLLVSAAVAVGGGAGVGVSVNVAVLSIHATALIDDNATVHAAKDVVVSAFQIDSVVSVTLSVGGGTVGVAGAIGVIVVGDQVWAKTGNGVTIVAGNNVGFFAQDDTKVTGIAGGAAGGFVGVGLGVYILVLTKDTEAVVASSSSVTANAGTSDALGGVTDGSVTDNGFVFGNFRGAVIQARSSEDIFGIVLSLGAGFVGVAVPVGVTVLTVTTQATLAGTISSGRDVNISALDRLHTITIAGGVGAGFVGAGAGVDIGVANNNTQALLLGTVSSARNVDVNALSWKHVTTYTFAVGAGAVGVGGAVSVWTVGTDAASNYDDGQGDTGNGRSELGDGVDPAGSADAGASGGGGNGYQSILGGTSTSTSDPVSSKTQSRIDSNSANSKSTIAAKGNSVGTPASAALSAHINPGTTAQLMGHVTATGNVTVNSDDNVAFGGIVGAAGGGAVGVGASILVGSIDAETTAEVGGSAVITTNGVVTVHSSLQESTSTLAFAGAGGAIGVAAQVTVLNDSSSQLAKIDDGAKIHRADGGVVVRAENNNRSVEALTIGGAIGGVAAGVAIGVVHLTGSTKASIGNATIGDTGTVGSVLVEAKDNSIARTQAIAVAAGIGVALNGAVALTDTHSSEVSARIAGGAQITVTGAITVNAIAKPQTTAIATGIGVAGGASLGVSYAAANNEVNVIASIGDGAHFSAGSLVVSAAMNVPGGAHPKNAYANAVAGGGGILLGAQGAFSQAETSGTVTASLGNNVFLPNGNVTVTSYGYSQSQADATGVGIGFIGIGLAIANGTSSVATSTTVGTGLNMSSSRTGSLTITSWGNSYTVSASTAGSGGVISGNGSVANTEDHGTAATSVGATGHTIYGSDITIGSKNDSHYYAHSDSTNASVVGAAGAFASFDGTTSSTTTLPSSLTVRSTGVVEISSQNNIYSLSGGSVEEADDNVDAAGGGGISLTAASSTQDINGHSTVNIGNNLDIRAENEPESNLASIGIDAGTQLLTHDYVKLETGGAIDGAGVNSSLTGHLHSNVNIGTGLNLYSTQNVGIGAYTIVVSANSSESSTFGLAAVGFADATVDVTTDESINVGSGAQIFGLGNVNIRTGDDSTGHYQTSLVANASGQSYVRGLIAIPAASADAHFHSNQNTTLTGATIHSGMNTTIGANPHDPITSADGTGHGYELGFIPVTDGSSDNDFDVTANVSVSGNIVAGFYHELTVNIADSPCGGCNGFSQRLRVLPERRLRARHRQLRPVVQPARLRQRRARRRCDEQRDPRQLPAVGHGAAPCTSATSSPQAAT